jgi:hypothetical protein
MTSTIEQKIACLERFDAAANRWFKGEYGLEGKEAIRKSLNEMVPIARTIIQNAGCLKLISVGPPPALGGVVIRNVDPFDMFFQDCYGISLIPNTRDMTQQAIGVLRSGHLEEAKVNTKSEMAASSKQLSLPEKVTLNWLVHNVPITLWLMGAGLLASAFSLGVKASTFGFIREIFGLL